jgi:hypothetical protein
MSKAAKHRFCPAVKHEISPAECGENRGSRYACPSDCLYSPLASANYELLLEVEDEVDRKTAELLEAEKRKSPELRKAAQQASTAPSPHAFHAFCECVLFFQRDADGLSLAERWRREGFPGLKNDERVLLEAKMRTRVALLEIHRIIDDQQIEAVDLLEAAPRPMLLRDRSLASMASRFSSGLVWMYPLPHYWRLSGTAIIIPDIAQFEPDEIIRETARHLGGPATEKELRAWLAENFVRMDESLTATGTMRQMQMFADMDAQFGKTVYELRAPFGACRDALDDIAEVEPDSLSQAERNEGFADARVWMTDQDPAKVAETPIVLGRVLLGQSHCRLESIGRERLTRLRRQFESVLGQRARFASERFDDLPSKLTEKEPPPNLAIIPPKLLENPSKLVLGASRVEQPHSGASLEDVEADQRARHYQAFLENPVPALDGHTPREAAQDPALRPKLIRLLKQWVRQHDDRNLRTGRNDDINWLLRELGLTEILFDAPPPRAKLPEDDEPDNEPDDEDLDDFMDESDFPLAVLPTEPLSPDEVAARIHAIFQEFETAKDALGYLDACGSMFLDDAASLCEAALEPEEFDLLTPCLMHARFVLVPRGFREPDLNFDRLAAAYDESLDRFSQPTEKRAPRAIFEWFKNSRQPFLAQVVALTMTRSFRDLPPIVRPSPRSELIMILTLRHMIDELDQAIRE